MKFDSGWLWPARYISTDNCSSRPADGVIDLLVIHSISLPPGQFVGSRWVDDLFTNQLDPHAHPYFAQIAHLKVSAHFLIERGGRVTQYVPLDLQAWHAGVSSYQGRENCNDYSIGIELEGDEVTPFTDAQYDALISLTNMLRAEYPAITDDRVVGHNQISPQRKTDPGRAFDWQRFLSHLVGTPARD